MDGLKAGCFRFSAGHKTSGDPHLVESKNKITTATLFSPELITYLQLMAVGERFLFNLEDTNGLFLRDVKQLFVSYLRE